MSASLAVLAAGCGSDAPEISLHQSDQPVVFFNGFTIPKFPTAKDQLNYARSSFPDPEEKRAAFEFVRRYFPKDRAESGEAVLHLAFMNFGFDYRFALLQDHHRAIEDYAYIIRYYADQPSVMAKAYWYMGWIYCDLLSEKEKGLEFYWRIVNEYPDVPMGISSPVPWVSLVYPDNQVTNRPAPKKTNEKWAGLALLEIIRHSPDQKMVSKAFDLIWKGYKNSTPTGLALSLMLKDETGIDKIQPYVQEYLSVNKASPFLVKKLKTAINKDLP